MYFYQIYCNLDHDHINGTALSINIPHWPGPSLLSLAIKIYPCCPQLAPHEFLHFQ